MGEEKEITGKLIGRKWRKGDFSAKVGAALQDKVYLSKEQRINLKDSFKSSIWRLEMTSRKQTYPVILKIFKTLTRTESWIELNMYQNGAAVFDGLLPEIYFIEPEVSGDSCWVAMEYVRPLKEQVKLTPGQFANIIPSLAEMHSRTFQDRYQSWQSLFEGWLPIYEGDALQSERMVTREKAGAMLEEAMQREDLKEKLSESYPTLVKLLERGPIYFPELIEAGQCIVHSDLQTTNMGCNQIGQSSWDIRFTDWEGAKYAPCWFDMVNLVGVFLAYRKEWRGQEEQIVKECAILYAKEMKKRGIAFRLDPVKLYKMAYLQRILEKSLYLQLHWSVNEIKNAVLLDGYLEKVNKWGKELELL
ncbi:hypothetical protein EBB07_25165 [Paenibacillaceae bacterium]|nr:hypothetical protein EBB07_25165 [Paenibacillaceae bacterium]